ncbi:MAG TPA: hypothetical protein VFV15_00110 [Moraxellaceae bacterium]|nr:hypothetical protein [Moraxellaceae bacterium]
MSTFAVVLIVVVAFVLGQMSLLRPSARDTRLMQLRAEARKAGLQPRLLAPPDWYRGERPVGGLLACYSLLLPEDAPGLPYFRAERLSDGEWVTRSGEGAVLRGLDLPPEAARLLALEARANAVSAWWKEEGGPEVLPALHSLLHQLQQKLQ